MSELGLLEWILFFIIAFIAIAGAAFLCLIKNLPVRIMCIGLLVSISLLLIGLLFYWQLQSSGFFIFYVILSLIATTGAVLLPLIPKVNLRIILNVAFTFIFIAGIGLLIYNSVSLGAGFSAGSASWLMSIWTIFLGTALLVIIGAALLCFIVKIPIRILCISLLGLISMGVLLLLFLSWLQTLWLIIIFIIVAIVTIIGAVLLCSIKKLNLRIIFTVLLFLILFIIFTLVFCWYSTTPAFLQLGGGQETTQGTTTPKVTQRVTPKPESPEIESPEIESPEIVLPGISERETICIAAGGFHIVGLKSDGTVVATGDNDLGECDVKNWRNIVAVSAGKKVTVGLKSDGTVVATGNNEDGQCYVKGWNDIIAIVTGSYHTVGLKLDGTVVATGSNYYGQCEVKGWKDIIAINAGPSHTVGLKSDGTVVAIGDNYEEECDVQYWKDIIKVSAGNEHTIGLKSDGTVVATGNNDFGQCDVEDWNDIIAISTGYDYTVGLKSDGTVVVKGRNNYGQFDAEDWKDIIKISAGAFYTVGVKSDGTVVATGRYEGDNLDGLDDWVSICVETEEEPETPTPETPTPETPTPETPTPETDDCSDVYTDVINDFFASGSFGYSGVERFEIYDSGWDEGRYLVYVRVYYEPEYDGSYEIEEYEFILENRNGECYIYDHWIIDYWTEEPEVEPANCMDVYESLIDDFFAIQFGGGEYDYWWEEEDWHQWDGPLQVDVILYYAESSSETGEYLATEYTFFIYHDGNACVIDDYDVGAFWWVIEF